MRFPDKDAVRNAVVDRLGQLMAQMAASAERTREGATHEEAKPENDKDTRAIEASYLARGQAMRVEELQEQIQVMRFLPLPTLTNDDAIDVGALVALEVDDDVRTVFVAPVAGGTEVVVDGIPVTVVTGGSPLGSALLGKTTGDDFELRMRGALREYAILAVR